MREKHSQKICLSTSPIFRANRILCKWDGRPRRRLLVQSLVRSTFPKGKKITASIIRSNRGNPKGSNSKTRISRSNLCRNIRILSRSAAGHNSTFPWTPKISLSRNASTINSKTKLRKSNWSEDKPPTTWPLITQEPESTSSAPSPKTLWTKLRNIGRSMSSSWSYTTTLARKNFGPFTIMLLTTSWKSSSKKWSTVW